jgi:hypothetical protein
VQVDPIKPMLKAPGTKRLKRNCHQPPSNFAFKFNRCRSTEELRNAVHEVASVVGRCRLTVSKPVLKAPMGSALETII